MALWSMTDTHTSSSVRFYHLVMSCVCESRHRGLHAAFTFPNEAVTVSFVNLTQPRITWEESVKGIGLVCGQVSGGCLN